MDFGCGSKNGCFKSLQMVSLWGNEISQIFRPGSRCSVERWWADLGSRGAGGDVRSKWYFWLILTTNSWGKKGVWCFFPILALFHHRFLDKLCSDVIFEVQLVAQARSQIMTRSVKMRTTKKHGAFNTVVVLRVLKLFFQSLWHKTCSMLCCLKTWLTFVFMCICCMHIAEHTYEAYR